MTMGQPKAALVLRPEQRGQLQSLANSRSLLRGWSRAKIVLLSASGSRKPEENKRGCCSVSQPLARQCRSWIFVRDSSQLIPSSAQLIRE
jgi:hypothetical protein